MMTPTCTPNPLRMLRERANLSQKTLAERLGWSQSKVSTFEVRRVREMKMADLEDFCRGLGLDLNVSIDEPDRMPCGAKP